MRKSLCVLAASCAVSVSVLAWASDKPIEVKPGEAIPSKAIKTNHLGPFKNDMPAVLPMVVVSFQTSATEKGSGGGSFMMGMGSNLEYKLDGISPELMQKIADEAQQAVEGELKAAGWQIMPAEKLVDMEEYKSWTKSPDRSGEETKRAFFSVGKGTNTFSSKEMERVFVGGKRPLVGNGVVLGGWTAAPSICKLGKAAGAKVILFRVIVNFANITAGTNNVFTGRQGYKSGTSLEISYAEMDVYPPDANGATPARIDTDLPVTMHSEFAKDVQKSKAVYTVVADPDVYEKDTVEAIRSVAKGFAAESNK
ncbi:MAG: hypothetical protein M3O31_00580 [Acidobacteriota bacterium]|nr:hypothetical protein [Acidobacteriota bacterium]